MGTLGTEARDLDQKLNNGHVPASTDDADSPHSGSPEATAQNNQETQQITRIYEKRPMNNNKDVEEYITGLAGLLLLRAMYDSLDSEIMVNVDWADEYGDIVVKLVEEGKPTRLILIKVCPRKTSQATASARDLVESADLGLGRYLRAFERLWDDAALWEREELRGLRDAALFVVYSNAAAVRPPGPAAPSAVTRLLTTGSPGCLRHLVPTAHPELASPAREHFLKRFVLCSEMASAHFLPELLRQELALQHGLLRRHDEPAQALRVEMRRYMSLEGAAVPVLGARSAPYSAFQRALAAQTRCPLGLRMSERSLDYYAARVQAAATAPAAAVWMPHSYPQLRTFCLVQMVQRAPSLALVKPLLVARAADVAEALRDGSVSALTLWQRGPGVLILDAEGVADCPHLQLELDAALLEGGGRHLLLVSAERGGWLPRALRLHERERIRVSAADLRDDVRAALLAAPVRLHGAAPAPLRTVVAEWGVGDIGVGPAELLLTPGPPVPIGRPLPQPDPLYVTRKLRSTVYVKDTIFKDEKLGDLFLISGASKEDLLQVAYEPEYVCTAKEARAALRLAQFIAGEGLAKDEDTFKDIAAGQKHRGVHWLRKTPEGLLWMASEGENAKMVDTHVELESMWAIRHKKSPLADVDQLLVRNDQMKVRQVVCDTPGTGKSALLRRVAERARELMPGRWVLPVHLGRLRPRLHRLLDKCVSQDAVLDLVQEAVHIEGEAFPALSLDVLKTVLWRTGDVVVLVDALDQAAPEYTLVAQDILSTLSKSPVAVLWVATRPSTRGAAEEALGTRAAELQPLGGEGQEALLVADWAQRGAREEGARRLAARLLPPLRGRCHTDAGAPDPRLPLALRLLAEAFEDEAILEGEAEGAEAEAAEVPSPVMELTTFELCARLVNKKFLRYWEQRQRREGRALSSCSMEKVRPEWLDGHCLCALAEVLKPRQLEKLSIDGRKERVRAFCEEVAAAGDAAARLVRPDGDNARFEHHVVAEYLAGYWLSENWDERHERIVRVYFSEGMEELRTVFDRFMTAGLALHKSVLDRTILMKNEAWIKDQGLLAGDRAGRTALHLAAQSHRPEIVSRLLAAGAPLEAKDVLLGGSPLYYAVRARSWECAAVLVARGAQLGADVSASRAVQRLLPRGTKSLVARYEVDWPVLNVPKSKHNPTSVLHLAAAVGNTAVLGEHKRPKTNAPDGGGWAALHWAASTGGVEAARVLLDEGADVAVRNPQGYTPLHLAVEKGDLKVVRLLVDRGGDARAVGRDGRTALHVAADFAQAKAMEVILQTGADQDLNLLDSRGEAPVHIAMEKGNKRMVEQLLRAGADGSLDGRTGLSPFFWAIKRDHLDLVRLMLLELKIDAADHKGSDGRTPLQWAAWKGNAAVAKLLLEAKVDTGLRDSDGNTALHLASREGHAAVARLLLGAGAEAQATGRGGRRPLHFAAACGSDAIVDALLTAGARVDPVDDGGDTPLHLAARNGFAAAVRRLLKAGADTEACGKFGRTALHWAVFNNHAKVVEALLDHGADIEACDKRLGQRAVQMARNCGHFKMAKLLLKRGATPLEQLPSTGLEASWEADDEEETVHRPVMRAEDPAAAAPAPTSPRGGAGQGAWRCGAGAPKGIQQVPQVGIRGVKCRKI